VSTKTILLPSSKKCSRTPHLVIPWSSWLKPVLDSLPLARRRTPATRLSLLPHQLVPVVTPSGLHSCVSPHCVQPSTRSCFAHVIRVNAYNFECTSSLKPSHQGQRSRNHSHLDNKVFQLGLQRWLQTHKVGEVSWVHLQTATANHATGEPKTTADHSEQGAHPICEWEGTAHQHQDRATLALEAWLLVQEALEGGVLGWARAMQRQEAAHSLHQGVKQRQTVSLN
jgi:hypothetical protein